jgi:hypothetical protein
MYGGETGGVLEREGDVGVCIGVGVGGDRVGVFVFVDVKEIKGGVKG